MGWPGAGHGNNPQPGKKGAPFDEALARARRGGVVAAIAMPVAVGTSVAAGGAPAGHVRGVPPHLERGQQEGQHSQHAVQHQAHLARPHKDGGR